MFRRQFIAGTGLTVGCVGAAGNSVTGATKHDDKNETDQEVATENDAENEGEDRDEEEDKMDEETHTLTVSLMDATVAGPMDGIVTVDDETKETEGPEAQFELEDGTYTIIGSTEDERWGGKNIVGIDGADKEVTVSMYPFFDIHVSAHDLIQTKHNGCETLVGCVTIENRHDRETWPVTAQFTVYTVDGEEVTQAGSEFFEIPADEEHTCCSEVIDETHEQFKEVDRESYDLLLRGTSAEGLPLTEITVRDGGEVEREEILLADLPSATELPSE